MKVSESDDLVRGASLRVSAASTMWFYIKSWLQDLRDAVESRDSKSIEIIAWQIEETAISFSSAIRERRLFRIDIDDSPIVFGTRTYTFANDLRNIVGLDVATAQDRIDAFQKELSSVVIADPDWLDNAIQSGHIKVLRSIARELSIVMQFGVESVIPEDWLI